MGRVWRTGQKKQVFIYRMIMLGTIEESILERQGVKEKLSSLIRQPDAADLAVQDITEGKSDDEDERETQDESLSLLDVQKKGDILQLVLPRGRDFFVEPTPSPRESLYADNSAGIDNVLDMMREPRMIIEISSTE